MVVTGTTRNRFVGVEPARGFESHHLRQQISTGRVIKSAFVVSGEAVRYGWQLLFLSDDLPVPGLDIPFLLRLQPLILSRPVGLLLPAMDKKILQQSGGFLRQKTAADRDVITEAGKLQQI